MPDSGKFTVAGVPPFTFMSMSRQFGHPFASAPRKSTSALIKSNANSLVPPPAPPSMPERVAVPPSPMKPATALAFAVRNAAPPASTNVLAGYHVKAGEAAGSALESLRTRTP